MSTHHHGVVGTGSKGWASGWPDPAPIELIEVTCVFDGDPTSDDAIVVGQLWLEEGEQTFRCPVCGDELTREVPHG